MRRLSITLAAAMALVLLATPALAKKGGIPGPPDKPEPEQPYSTTCFSPYWEGDVQHGDFTIELTRETPDACVDVVTHSAGVWTATVERAPNTLWRRPELLMVPRDAAFPSDSCGGEKRVGDTVFEEWTFPPPDDPRGFTEVPVATVNACPGHDAASLGGNDIGHYGELVERPDESSEVIYEVTDEVHPLAFVVWSHNLRKGERIIISVDIPD